MMWKLNFIALVSIFQFTAFLPVFGQNEAQPTKPATLSFQIGVGSDWAFGDLSDRFGRNDRFNIGMEWKTSSNFTLGAEFSYLYGSQVKDTILRAFQNSDGRIFGYDGLQSDVFARERGAFLGLIGGKLMALDKKKTHNLRLAAGFGLMYHKIRILDETRAVAQIFGDYAKGYDKLTRGPSIKQQLGYECHSDKLHFNIALEAMEAFTKNIRAVNFDSTINDQSTRLDVMLGVRLTWMLPLYKSISTAAAENIYY